MRYDTLKGEHVTHAICKALVPSTLALSYLVIYGVVIRFCGGTARPPSAGKMST